MSTTITSHGVVTETIRVSAVQHEGTEWLQLKWKDDEGSRGSITLFLADSDARSALERLAQQILNATVEFEVARESESKQGETINA